MITTKFVKVLTPEEVKPLSNSEISEVNEFITRINENLTSLFYNEAQKSIVLFSHDPSNRIIKAVLDICINAGWDAMHLPTDSNVDSQFVIGLKI